MSKQLVGNLSRSLQGYKVSTLNDIALHCGSPILGTTKATRIEGILSQYQLYLTQWHSLTRRNTLSIDIGVKNFSYCKTSTKATESEQLNISNWPLLVTHWEKINLDTQYGSSYKPLLHQDTVLDTKRYLNHITNNLITDRLTPESSNVKIMEIQRTRSNNNAKTLPTIMTNHTLENLLLAKMYPDLVIPMTSMKLIHFWLYRFITKESTVKLKRTNKIIRRDLILAWFGKLYQLQEQKQHSVDKSGGLTVSLLLEYLGLPQGEKTDDLIDSLLYNLCINCQLNHLAHFHKYVENENNDGNLIDFIEDANQFHLGLIEPVVDKYNLDLK
ncbi:CCE1 [Candida theae]|uniref:CCE1 n=1 Tax=Candida theae TaxID=1198502 RepID=A0AAD5FXQ0_9ASCO|nr:CCE1 [Candida theae]KAI5954827.1 CCE1 [Candida theae]